MANETQSIVALLEQQDKRKANGAWVVASGGTEKPFVTRNLRRLLYCWQPSTGNHAYLDCDTDIILSFEEADFALGFR